MLLIEQITNLLKTLESHGVNYSDWGETTVAGWKQIFL